MTNLSAEVVALAGSSGLWLVTAESCTGGMIAAAITDVAGASAVFDRGFVTYTNAAKHEMLGVQKETLAAFGAVSEPVAAEMASGALAVSGAGLAVSVTGIAGPGGGSAEKPEGMVCFGLAQRDRSIHTETIQFGALGRRCVRLATVEHALALVRSALVEA